MNNLPSLKKFSIGKPRSKEWAICDEIYKALGKKLPFPALMSMCKNKGTQFVFECYREAKESKEPMTLFLWLYGRVKIV